MDVEKSYGKRADVAAGFGRPCHRTWKTSITRQSLKRRPPHLLAVGKTRKRGSRRETRRTEDVLRDSTWRKRILAEESAALFRETRQMVLLFYHPSLCSSLPPSLSFSLLLLFLSTVSNPDVGRYKLMKCLEWKRSAVPLKITSAACRNNPCDASCHACSIVFITDSIHLRTIKVFDEEDSSMTIVFERVT